MDQWYQKRARIISDTAVNQRATSGQRQWYRPRATALPANDRSAIGATTANSGIVIDQTTMQ